MSKNFLAGFHPPPFLKRTANVRKFIQATIFKDIFLGFWHKNKGFRKMAVAKGRTKRNPVDWTGFLLNKLLIISTFLLFPCTFSPGGSKPPPQRQRLLQKSCTVFSRKDHYLAR